VLAVELLDLRSGETLANPAVSLMSYWARIFTNVMRPRASDSGQGLRISRSLLELRTLCLCAVVLPIRAPLVREAVRAQLLDEGYLGIQ
jgi:hypothetical protein